ncbi:MAG: hypothetical protein ACR2K4_03080 [Candidatus Limnocylindria bacterium]
MEEPCISCGRETRVGTRLFSARKRGLDTATDDEGFLCSSCQQGSAGTGVESTAPLSGRYVVIDLGNMPG